MKAPSVREGSKENRTQVTKNRICKRCLVWKSTLPDQAPIRKNSPGVDHAQETGTDPLESHLISIKSYPAITVLSPRSVYGSFMKKVMTNKIWKILGRLKLGLRRAAKLAGLFRKDGVHS